MWGSPTASSFPLSEATACPSPPRGFLLTDFSNPPSQGVPGGPAQPSRMPKVLALAGRARLPAKARAAPNREMPCSPALP